MSTALDRPQTRTDASREQNHEPGFGLQLADGVIGLLSLRVAPAPEGGMVASEIPMASPTRYGTVNEAVTGEREHGPTGPKEIECPPVTPAFALLAADQRAQQTPDAISHSEKEAADQIFDKMVKQS